MVGSIPVCALSNASIMTDDSQPLLEIRDLQLEFATRDRSLRALDGVSLTVREIGRAHV